MFERILGAAFSLCLWSLPSTAAVLTFDGLGLYDGEYIPQTYGDLAHLDVSYQSREGFGNTAALLPELSYWNTGYSDKTGVAYAVSDDSVAEIAFVAAAGYVGKISSLEFGKYATEDINGSFAIYDSSWNVLWSLTESSIWDGGINISPDISFTGTAYVQWGTSWNLGLDRLTYSVTQDVPQPSPVPLPAGLPLLGAGLLAFGGLRMRRRG